MMMKDNILDRAISSTLTALGYDPLHRLQGCSTAKAAWENLESTNAGR